MKTGIYFQDPKYVVGRFGQCFSDPSCVLYLPLYRLDGASFMSKDAYGHLCTAGKSVWTPQGHSFDGLDDDINCGSGSSFPAGNSDRTILIWIYPKTISLPYQGFFLYGKLGNSQAFRLATDPVGNILEAGKYGGDVKGTTLLTLDVWQQIGVTLNDGNQINFYSNGQVDGPYTLDGIATYLTMSKIGVGGGGWDDPNLDGLVGEARLYNRALNGVEIQHNYLATKWRYQ